MGPGDVRTMVHATWAAVAPNWAEYADALDAHEAVLAQRMLEGVAISPGERVLELACEAASAWQPLPSPGPTVRWSCPT